MTDLKHTFYTDEGFDVITTHDGRYHAFEMPGGGWVVKDEQGHNFFTGGDRVADVYAADALIGSWMVEEVMDRHQTSRATAEYVVEARLELERRKVEMGLA